MIRIRTQGVVMGGLLALALTPAFWPSSAAPEERDEICEGHRGTALWGQCTRAVDNGCHLDPLAHPRCEQWAQSWRDQTGDDDPPWLVCGGDGSCLVFVTSQQYRGGELGGLSGADDICQAEAEAATQPGTFKAWLADSTGSPLSRFTQASVPYELVDGTQVAADWANLVDGDVDTDVILKLDGTAVCDPAVQVCPVWSAVDVTTGGFLGGPTCDDWSDQTPAGDTGGRIQRMEAAGWPLIAGFELCTDLPPLRRRLLCIEQ